MDIGVKNVPGFGIPFITRDSPCAESSVLLWTTEHCDPLLKVPNSPSSGYQNCRLFYRDELILLTRGNQLHFYQYTLDRADPASIRPALKKLYNRASSVGHLPVLSTDSVPGTSISALGCVNSVYSNVILCAGRNKSLQLVDIAYPSGKAVWTVADAMRRPIHDIGVNDSAFAFGIGRDVFATAAIGESVDLWDMRLGRSVRRFFGHVDRGTGVGISFSPCGRFLASGSEVCFHELV